MQLATRSNVALVFLALALLFGGGGAPSPFSELIVQIAALLAIVAWILCPTHDLAVPDDRPLWVCVAVFAAIPFVQLIPLPPFVWHALPGREIARQILAQVGAAEHWRPLSIAPYRTLAAALSLIPPVAMIFFTSQLAVTGRSRLILAVLAIVMLSAIVGVIQVASGSADWPRFYDHVNEGFATGFQDNRNATADVLLIGILALATVIAARGRTQAWQISDLVFTAVTAFLVITIILTGSRAGTLLAIPTIAGAILILRPHIRLSRQLLIGTGAGLVVVCIAGFALRDNPALDRTWQRFEQVGDARPGIWEDTRYAIGQYWPTGAGMGTFTAVFPSVEQLESVSDKTPNRAHQDYLEFALEAGLPGLLILAGLALAAVMRIRGVLRTARSTTWGTTKGMQSTQTVFASATLAILALHSLVDYPMRSMSLATLAGLSVGLLSRTRRGRDGFERPMQSGRLVR